MIGCEDVEAGDKRLLRARFGQSPLEISVQQAQPLESRALNSGGIG